MPRVRPTPTFTPNPFGARWERAVTRSIQVDNAGTVWNAGHVSDMVELSPVNVLVASHSSGVWLLSAGAGAALSLDWDSTWMNCLATDPAEGQDGHPVKLVFAGGGISYYSGGLGALYVTDTSADDPIAGAPWIRIPIDSSNIGVVHDVLVLPDPSQQDSRIVVLAAENGIYWSAIPTDPHGAYQWLAPSGSPSTSCGFWSLAPAPNGGFYAGAYKSNLDERHFGIYTATWQYGAPALAHATITGTDFDIDVVSTTSVASGAGDHSVAYAICADAVASGGTGVPYRFLRRSADGTWTASTMNIVTPLQPRTDWRGEMGDQGIDWGNCIAVAPQNANMLAIGWVAGPFLSTDGGATFSEMNRFGTHDDKHALVFTPTDGGRLYLGCDGGISFVHSIDQQANGFTDPTWDSSYNQWLTNLQFLSPTRKWFAWWGRADVAVLSGQKWPHIIGGGLQDNDDVYALASPGGASPGWRPVTSLVADGGWVLFPASGGALHANAGCEVRHSALGGLDGTTLTFDQRVPIQLAGHHTNLPLYAFVDLVPSPTVHNMDGQPVIAIGVTKDAADVWALFHEVTGVGLHWEYRMTLPTTVASDNYALSLASAQGARAYIGMSSGGVIFSLDLSASAITATPSSGLPGGAVGRISMARDGSPRAFALLNDSPANGVYQTTDGSTWNLLSGLPNTTFYCMDVDWDQTPPHIFVGTDDAVYASPDAGMSWENISNGLPKRPHCADLRYLNDTQTGRRYLYVSTCGWSVWRCALSS